jgi:hypothetical protein
LTPRRPPSGEPSKRQGNATCPPASSSTTLDLPALGQQFDTVVDCGLFHVFEDQDRPRFEASLRSVVPSGGRYYLLCFSDRQPGVWGPRRIRQEEIRDTFAERDGWQITSIEAAIIEVTFTPEGAQAWLASITRT